MNRDKALILIVVVCIVLLVPLAFAAKTESILPLDRSVTLDVQSANTPPWTSFMEAVSWPGYPPQTFVVYGIWFVLLLVWLGWRALIEGFIALGGASLTGETFKQLINRVRPDGPGIFVAQRGLEGGRFSFPAGHVEAVVAVGLITLWMMYQVARDKGPVRAFAIIVVVVCILMGVSRIALGEHWLSDVVGGYLVGLLWVCLAIIISHRWLSKRMSYRVVKD